jgi:alpha/beta superfamily hydrolase
VEDLEITSGGLTLRAYFARPPGHGRVPAALVVPGFPRGTGGATTSTHVYRSLAERIPDDVGWAACTWWFRGTGPSPGSFSIDGWQEDLAATVDHVLARDDVSGVWLVGFRLGGTLAILHAAADPRVRGLATFAAPATLRAWVRDPAWFHAYCKRVGVLRADDFPPDVGAWARAIEQVDAVAVAPHLVGRPWLLVHGSDDDVVPPADAAALAAACPTAELRIVGQGMHRLRHDPRAVAALIGWLDRQAP